MINKVIDIVFSFVPTNWNFGWTQNLFSPRKRAREDEFEDNLPIVPSKKQKYNTDVLAELNCPFVRSTQTDQPSEKLLGIVKRKIVYNRNETDSKQKQDKQFFQLKYDSFKENVQYTRCRSTPVAPLSPAKFKNAYKAPRHVRSPNKAKNSYLKNFSHATIDLTKSYKSYRRIPLTMSEKENDESSSQTSPVTQNGNRYDNLSREDYNRLIGKFNSAPTVDVEASASGEAGPVADTPTPVDNAVYDISDDENGLVASPPVQPINTMAASTNQSLARSSQLMQTVLNNMIESRTRFEQIQKKYAQLFEQSAIIRHQSTADYLVERIRDHVRITESVSLQHSISDQPLPRLTPEMEKKILDAFRPYPSDAVIANKYKYKLTRKEFQCLASLNWLNDEVINFYMELISMRSKENKGYPNVYTFGTFFYPRLKSTGPSSVKRWTKKVDIFECDMILVPIHLHVHWCMSCIDLKQKSITFYDSMGSNNLSVLNSLKEYLEYEYKEKKHEVLDMSEWTLKQAENIPQQNNGCDCGVFTCQFAEFLSRGAEFTFSQSDMPYFRKKMAWEFMEGKLLT